VGGEGRGAPVSGAGPWLVLDYGSGWDHVEALFPWRRDGRQQRVSGASAVLGEGLLSLQ
jgi:hypothetical protein